MAHLSVRENHRLQVTRLHTQAVLERKVRSAQKEGGNRLAYWKNILAIRIEKGWS